MSEYLYHYTNIETLLLILKNKTIAFNSLQNVDDLEECQSEDIKQIGKICYVSCWTDDESESIPMWNMYTQGMQGVRIKMKKFPFVKYGFKRGEYQLNTDIETFIDLKKLYEEDKTTITCGEPRLIKVNYTDDDKLIYPKIKTIKKEFLKQNNENVITKESTSYSFENIGKYKRKNWEFQNEVRYVINMSLWSMKELENCKDCADQNKLIERLEDSKYKSPYNLFFLDLTDEALEDLEILLGPKITEAQTEIVKLIVEKYCPSAKIVKSNLKIK